MRALSVPTLLAVVGIALVALILHRRGTKSPPYTPRPGSLTNRVILITGGTTGLGLESAQRLAAAGARIVITARTEAKGEQALKDIQTYLHQHSVTNQRVSYKILQLDDLHAIRKAVTSWRDIRSIDVLMNNAGVMGIQDRELTVDGWERQMQTNHLGHFLLTALVAPRFSKRAVIINLSSDAYKFSFLARGLDFSFFWKGAGIYTPFKAYSQSKLANILFTLELQKRIDEAGKGWVAVAVHPGAVATGIVRHFFIGNENYEKLQAGTAGYLIRLWSRVLSATILTPAQGASTQVWLAAGGATDDPTVKGHYIVDGKVEKLWKFANNTSSAARLWSESEENAGVRFRL